MDVRLSAEQQALRASVVHVVENLGPRSVRDLGDEERRAKLDAAIDASGWRELRAPADTGAPLASGVEVAIVAEELACGLADAPFLGPTLATELRRCAAAPAARSPETVALTPDLSHLAEVVVAGTAGLAEVVVAGTAGPDPAGTDPARPDPAVAIDAAGASSAVLLATGGAGPALASMALAAPSAALPVAGPRTSVDLTRPGAVVRSGDPEPEPEVLPEVVGRRSLGDDDLVRWTALALSTTSAELVGTMRGALDLATEYAKSRRQYGVAIGSFQAVQHLLADALVSLEGARSVALHASWAVDALSPADALSAASLTKAYCARAARRVCEVSIQVHGGIGNTWDCLAHVHLRRALLSIDVMGGVGPNLERVLDATGLGGVRGLR